MRSKLVLENKIRKVSPKLKNLKQKTAQAVCDKLELMRDVATYEANLSDELNLRKTLMVMHKNIDNTKKSLSANS